jgi:hypothetical protein
MRLKEIDPEVKIRSLRPRPRLVHTVVEDLRIPWTGLITTDRGNFASRRAWATSPRVIVKD